jgi:hypothetical protein
MPALSRRPIRLAAGVPLAVALLTCAAFAQTKQPDATGAGAVKLPDGTIVFFTKSSEDANPPVNGVLLSAKEYQTLVEQAEQFRKLKDTPKSQTPSRCEIRGKIQTRGDRTVAALSVTYSFRTTTPRTVVALGGRRAFAFAAKLSDGKLPILSADEEGLTALVESVGEHTLTLELETPVGPRGGKGELGFEVGLPRAAITTLALDPPAGVKTLTVGVRYPTDRPIDPPKRTTEQAATLARKPNQPGYPLGTAESLEVAWALPTAAPGAAEAVNAADIDVTVRVEEAQIETSAVVRLHGPAREWSLILPPGADVTARQATPATAQMPPVEPPFATAPTPTLTRPTDPARTAWTFHPPDTAGPDWVLTVTTRQARPKAPNPKHNGPFAVGPFAVPTAARQSGSVRMYAPPTIRLEHFKHSRDVRAQDVPPEEELAAAFKFTTVTTPAKQSPGPLLEFDTRDVEGFVVVQPAYTLRWGETGWRLEAEVRVTPFRTEAEQVLVEVPTGWQPIEAGPFDLVDGVQETRVTDAGRLYAVRLAAPQKSAFALTLTTTFPLDPPTAREVTLPLPRFPGSRERNAKVTASVRDKWEVRGTGTAPGAAAGQELKPAASAVAKASAAVTSVTGQFERGLARLALNWHPYRPELSADVHAEVELQNGQATVTQVIRFRSAEADVGPIPLSGPAEVRGLKAKPGDPVRLDPNGVGEWVLRPTADAGKEFTATLKYALPLPTSRANRSPNRFAVGLLWPTATRTETTLRVWGAGSDRPVARFDGPWRELPPAPDKDHDSLPWLTLVGTGALLPLTLELADSSESGLPNTAVERVLIQAWLAEDGGIALRGRFLLRRWSPGGIDIEVPVDVMPDILADGQTVTPAASRPIEANGSRTLHVPLPEPRAGRPSVLLDVRYLLPAVSSVGDAATLVPPRLVRAAYHTPPRWEIVVPLNLVPLHLGRNLRPEIRWALHNGLLAPTAGASTAELDRWIAGEANTNFAAPPLVGDALTGCQISDDPVVLYRVPRLGWVAACSLAALVAGLVLSRLRASLLGPVLGVVGVAAAAVVAVWPQPAAWAVAAAEPGLVALAVILAATASLRGYYRWRVTHLPGFTRTAPAVVVNGTPSAVPTGARASGSGSAVALEAATSNPPLSPSGSGS